VTADPVNIDFRVSPSTGYALFVSVLHAVILVFLVLLPLSWSASSILLAALAVSLVANRYRYARVKTCRLKREDQVWTLALPDLQEIRVDCRLIFKNRWLLLLRLKNSGRCWTVPVFADSLPLGDFCCLCRQFP